MIINKNIVQKMMIHYVKIRFVLLPSIVKIFIMEENGQIDLCNLENVVHVTTCAFIVSQPAEQLFFFSFLLLHPSPGFFFSFFSEKGFIFFSFV